MSNNYRGKTYLALAAFFWGTLGLAASIAMNEGMSPESISFFRAFIGSLVGIPLVGRGFFDKRLMLLGLAFTGPLYLSYVYSVKHSGIGIAAALLYLAPSIVVLLSPKFLGERITARKALAVTLATVGAVLTQVKGGELNPNVVGVAFGLITAFSYAGIIMYVRKLVSQGYRPIQVGIAPQLWASLELLPFAFSGRVTLVGLGAVIYLGIFTAALAYVLQAKGLELVDAGSGSVISTLEPFVALIIGLLVGEDVGFEGVLGSLLIILASAIV